MSILSLIIALMFSAPEMSTYNFSGNDTNTKTTTADEGSGANGSNIAVEDWLP
jgi:hypothetical protein